MHESAIQNSSNVRTWASITQAKQRGLAGNQVHPKPCTVDESEEVTDFEQRLGFGLLLRMKEAKVPGQGT